MASTQGCYGDAAILLLEASCEKSDKIGDPPKNEDIGWPPLADWNSLSNKAIQYITMNMQMGGAFVFDSFR